MIEKNGKFFLVRNVAVGDFYHLIGGRLEQGESLRQALTREIKEETGKDSDIGNLLAIHRIKYKDSYLPTSYIFHIKNAEDFEDIDLTNTTHGQEELEEFGFIDIAKERILPSELIKILPQLLDEGFAGPCRIIESDFVEV